MLNSYSSSSPGLNSWKEIARFFDRGIRTVQRWEQELDLPVHRIGKSKRSPVFAVVSELKFWMFTAGKAVTHPEPAIKSSKELEAGRRQAQLSAHFHELAYAVGQTSVRHQRQIEALRQTIRILTSQLRDCDQRQSSSQENPSRLDAKS